MNVSITVNKKKIILYLILVPFFFPRGFCNFIPMYKGFYTIIMYFSMIISMGVFIKNIIDNKFKINFQITLVLLYFLFIFIETIIIKGNVNEGLQKIFSTPILCLVTIIFIEKQEKEFVNVLSNVLICILFLNVTAFCPYVFNNMVHEESGSLIQFIGHVQVASQISILGIFLSNCLILFNEKKKAKTLIVLSLITMIIANTDVSIICIICICIFFLFRKFLIKFVDKIATNFLFLNMYIFNLFVCIIVIAKKIDFGARYYVWLDFLNKIKNHIIFGYGVYGAKLTPFWVAWEKNNNGMNYAHNDIFQHILDGGIILMILYLITFCLILKNTNKICNYWIKYWGNICIFLFLIIAIPESITEYNYFYMLVFLLAFWKINEKNNGDELK